MPSADISRLTAIVHAGRGVRSTSRLVLSIRQFFPQLRVIVADDSGLPPHPIAGADLVKQPTGVGASACRNALLARVRTPYFLLLEDNLELSKRTRLEQLLSLVASDRVDVAAGDCLGCQQKFFFLTSSHAEPLHATFHRTGDEFAVRPGHRFEGEGFLACDSAHNFFVAHTDKIRSIGGWDGQLATDERIEFFVRAERFGLRVGVCPEVIARRWADRGLARNTRDLAGLALAKMGVAKLVDEAGHIHVAATPALRLAA